MPMNWTPEADAKLMAGIMHIFEIKPSAPQAAALAKIMGPECTAKAVVHRLAALRKKAGLEGSAAVEGGRQGPEKRKKARVQPGRKANVKSEDCGEDDDEDGDGNGGASPSPSPSPSPVARGGGRKRGRGGGRVRKVNVEKEEEEVVEAEVLDDGEEITVGEDVGQGFRMRVRGDGEEDDDENEDDGL